MRWPVPLLLSLLACGDPREGVWVGRCALDIGETTVRTAALIRSEGEAVQWSGIHTLYTGAATVDFPGSTLEGEAELVWCEDPEGCDAPTASYRDGDLILTVLDVSGTASLTGWGPASRRSMEGRCRTAFGEADFDLERE